MSSSTTVVIQAPADVATENVLSTLSVDDEGRGNMSKGRAVALMASITCITAINNVLGGLLTVCIPVIASELRMPPELQLWPLSAFALACGCTLLPCGAAADVLGCRRVCILGGVLQAILTLGTGLAATSTQLIGIRAVGGIATSLCLPSAVGVVAHSFPTAVHPRLRSFAFATLGGGQAFGFGLGLVLGGVCADTVGWRWAFYSTALFNCAAVLLALWALPSAVDGPLDRDAVTRLTRDIDWVGASIISTALALLSYELAVATGSNASKAMRQPLNITLLCAGLALFLAFAPWMRRQVRLNRPALIPNALWANIPFTTVCVIVFLIWSAFNSSEQTISLYVEQVRGAPALTASLYFLPAPICGALMNVAIGASLPYMRPSLAVPAGCLVSGIAPLLLAVLCRTDGPGYWKGLFQATALNPLGADLIYTIANLVVTAAFPTETQALAGSVFNMVAQIGKSVGIATTVLIARQVTMSAADEASDPKEALLQGYRASLLYNSALGFVSVAVSFWGLRNVGKLGVKRE